jgi:dienelactone hydrolase
MTLRHKKRLVNVCILILLIPLAGSGYLIVGPGRTYLRAASLLQRIADGKGSGRLARMDAYPVDEQTATVQTINGPIPARLYVPRDVADPPGMVILHGVHHLGIEEPRLVAFSRAMSSSGIVVLTPELKDIADYHVSRDTIDTIGAAAKSLSVRLGGEKVGVMGLSFSGGLSLLAAADPRYAGSIGFVVSIGGHDDLTRVCEFFATDKIASPDGSIENLKAHEYGALVVVYSHPEDFFSAADVPAAREALRLLLWEDENSSRAAAAKLSAPGRARMELLFSHKKDALATELMASINRHRSEAVAVSPHGNLANLHVPVLLLHGAGDTVIPASETRWLEKEVPAPWMRSALITPLLTHVDVGGSPPLKDQWDMVAFIAELLRQSDRCTRQSHVSRHAEYENNSGKKYGYVRLNGGHLGHAG